MTKKFVFFHHPERSPKTWYLGYEEGNQWVTIGYLHPKMTPDKFAEILKDIDSSEIKVDVSVRR